MRQVAVFDTNILFSATGWKGVPYECLELARAGQVDGVTCLELLDELAEKLQAKLLFSTGQAVETLTDLLTFLRVVSISGQLKAVPADPDDDKVCAKACRFRGAKGDTSRTLEFSARSLRPGLRARSRS
ncbi:MAG TPA: PIN domain-containing protein [Pirellulales bacterium]|nr:PIN domain-containing protein [Pirellulales bacterium]